MKYWSPLEMRLRQELLYTMHVAEAVVAGKRTLSADELRSLDRYARWHFGVRDFRQLVEENLEMLPGKEEAPASKKGKWWNW